jgi:hypothetical protein
MKFIFFIFEIVFWIFLRLIKDKDFLLIKEVDVQFLLF